MKEILCRIHALETDTHYRNKRRLCKNAKMQKCKKEHEIANHVEFIPDKTFSLFPCSRTQRVSKNDSKNFLY